MLTEISTSDAVAKRRLLLELAGSESPHKLVHEIKKRLNTLARSTSLIEWHSLKVLKADLDSQRRLIADQVAMSDTAEALDLMWQFIDMAKSVFERTDDGYDRYDYLIGALTPSLGSV